MALISKLRPLIKPAKLLHQSVRRSGGNVMNVEPANYTVMLYWDKFHFYAILGAIPCFLIGGYMSIFYGDSVLVDIPEGYEPEDWECERNPVQRLIARYILQDSVYAHEWVVGRIAEEQDSRFVKMAIQAVKQTQLRHRDYRAWYFQPLSEAAIARADKHSRDRQHHYEHMMKMPDVQDRD